MSWRLLRKLIENRQLVGLAKDVFTIPMICALSRCCCHPISFDYKKFCTKRQQPDSLNQANRYTDCKMSNNLSVKPPNILIYSCQRYALEIQNSLEQYLDGDRYVFLNINEKQLTSEPWSTNTQLVILTNEVETEPVQRVLLKYWRKNGRILSLGSDFLTNLKVKLLKPASAPYDEYSQVFHEFYGETKLRLIGDLCSAESFNGQKIALSGRTNNIAIGALQDTESDGIVVFSQVSLFGDDDDDGESHSGHLNNRRSWKKNVLLEILRDVLKLDCISTSEKALPKETPCCLYGLNSTALDSFLKELSPRLDNGVLPGAKVSFQLSELTTKQPSEVPHQQQSGLQVIPVFIGNRDGFASDPSFTPHIYFDHLKTKVLGHVVWYGKVMTSTMDIFHSSNIPQGVVCIAERQTNGRGRGNHTWLSPEGCAMFSVQISVAFNTNLGRHLTFVQHLAAIAIVEGVKSMLHYENVDLKLKWPNDIYFGDCLVKLGGVIVQSTLMADKALCTIGCGLNVNNRKPTVCLNDVIRSLNPELSPLSREIVIARAITKLEELIDAFQRNERVEILDRYYSLWLHGGAKIKLATPDGSMQPAVIDGLDDHGFLRVRLDDSLQILTVQPDGNSFDALHNLLIIR